MYTKETDKLHLPIFEYNDHPDFLTDWNEAMYKIDSFAESSGIVSDDAFDAVVRQQLEIIDDVKSLKATDDDFERTLANANSSIDELSHVLSHEHERNDIQDGKILNLQADADKIKETIEQETANLKEAIEQEADTARDNENRINSMLSTEIERSTAEDKELNRQLNELVADNVDIHTALIDYDYRIKTEHNTNDAQELKINKLTETAAEHWTSIQQNHQDILELKERVDQPAADLSELTQSVEKNSSDITEIKERLDGVPSEEVFNQLVERVDTAESDITGEQIRAQNAEAALENNIDWLINNHTDVYSTPLALTFADSPIEIHSYRLSAGSYIGTIMQVNPDDAYYKVTPSATGKFYVNGVFSNFGSSYDFTNFYYYVLPTSPSIQNHSALVKLTNSDGKEILRIDSPIDLGFTIFCDLYNPESGEITILPYEVYVGYVLKVAKPKAVNTEV